MVDSEPRSTASRALRASVGLTVLATALLACGAAVEATGNLLGPSANGGGSGSHPATTVQPTRPRPSPRPRPRLCLSEAPSPSCPPPTSPAHLPRPTAIATAGDGSVTRW